MSRKVRYWFLFFSGVAISLIILPFLYAIGIPSFAVVLDTLFGENSILALVFSFVLVAILLLSVGNFIRKEP